MAFATAGRSPEERDEIVKLIQETAREWAVYNFSSGCEVADMLVQRLDFGPDVREALRFTFERWNGNGYPDHAQGEAIPLADARRAPQPRHGGDRPPVLARARDRGRPRSPRPHLRPGARRPLRRARARLARPSSPRSSRGTPCSPSSPSRTACSSGEQLDDALTVAADFIDLKSPYMGGHSRRCAELAADAARVLGLAEEAVTTVRRAALVHDFGTTVVPNSIWDKPGPLTRTEFDRVELHPLLTEQMLRRSPALAVLNPVAAAHHEKCDGSGYHKRVQADADDLGACVLAATEIYVGLTTERADRPPFSPADAAAELRQLESDGRARAAREPRGARGRGARRAARRPRASGSSIPAGSRGARSTCCGSRPGASRRARSPTGSTSPPRPPITTSSTSTARSARRREPRAALWAMQHAVVQ